MAREVLGANVAVSDGEVRAEDVIITGRMDFRRISSSRALLEGNGLVERLEGGLCVAIPSGGALVIVRASCGTFIAAGGIHPLQLFFLAAGTAILAHARVARLFAGTAFLGRRTFVGQAHVARAIFLSPYCSLGREFRATDVEFLYGLAGPGQSQGGPAHAE